MFLDPDRALSVFSSEGKLTQCDNALRAATNGALAVCSAAPDGCVLAANKSVNRLVVKPCFHKVFNVCPTIGVTYAGLQPDFRVQLGIAQDICQAYFDVYGTYPSIDTFVAEFSLTVQDYTLRGGYRPFGTVLLFCGAGMAGPRCYQVDPSGSFAIVTAGAAGTNRLEAAAFIEHRLEGVDDNISAAVLALKNHAGTDLAPEDVSIGVFRDGAFSVYTPDGVTEVFDATQN